MNQQPRIVDLPSRTLVGIQITTSLAKNDTPALWRSFLSRRSEISGLQSSDLYSAAVYPTGYYETFDPTREFEKWAAIHVEPSATVPSGMQTLSIEGIYAVFVHTGPAHTAPATFQYIFTVWLPQSDFVVDHRPHFEIMTEHYRPESEDSTEELYIPVRRRGA